MSASLSNDNSCNWRATFRARFTCALINPEIILEITSPVDPIYAGTIPDYTIPQHHSDAVQQAFGLLLAQPVCWGERMQLS